MQFEEARDLERMWEERKKKNPDLVCNHPHIEKEYYLSADTGDYVCTICGLAQPRENFR